MTTASLKVTFYETPTSSKTSPLVDDDLDEEKAIKFTEKKNLENDIGDETLEIDEIVNIKESKNHPLENVIGNLNQRNLSLEDSKPMKTPMSSDTKLTIDKEFKSVDSTKYQGMIGSLLYLTRSRPDIMFSVCLCARFQEVPKTSHLEAVKRIFRYIKGTTHLGLWHPKGTSIKTVVYADFDHAGDYVDQKSTSGEYSQWVERFINYLEEQRDRKAMINSIKNGDQPLPRVTQVSIAGTLSTEQPPLKEKSMCNKTAKDLWDALARHNCKLNFKFLNNLQLEWKLYATMMRQNKNLMDINIDALYNILKQNQGDVNDDIALKKKTIMVTSNPLALIAEKTKVSKRKEKVVVSLNSKGSDADDFSELKKILSLLAKAFNRRKFYSKPTNNNLRTSSTSQSSNKKQEFVKSVDKKVKKKDDDKKTNMRKVKCYNCKKEGNFAKECKKVKVKDYEYYKTKMLLAKKDKDKQVFLAEDQAWMESSSDSDQEINANIVFMAQIEKVLSDSETSSSSADDKISEVS
nr:uncharacterized mitochondrial protein AtMg00810-like [Tanacetum cinerariifolium]